MATVTFSNVAVNSTRPKSAPSVSVAPGDILAVYGYGQDGTVPATPTNTGTALGAWTLQRSVNPGTQWTPSYFWTATATGTDASVTVSVDRTSAGSPSTAYGFTMWKVSGASAVGASNSAQGTSGAASVSLTTTGANSIVLYGSGDWNPATGSASWRSVNGSTGTAVLDTTPADRFYARHWMDAGAAGANTYGLSLPTGQQWTAIAVEIQTTPTVSPTGIASTAALGSPTVVGGQLTVTPTGIASTARMGTPTAWAWWVAGWPAMTTAPEWRALIESPERTIKARAELVDRDGRKVSDMPFHSASIDLRGESAEQWAGRVSFTDESMAPMRPTDPLDPRSMLRARFWWRILYGGRTWLEVPVGTFIIGDPEVSDSSSGSYGISVQMRDVLEEVSRNEYGEKLISVGGLTVDAALKRLFATLAPWATVSIPATTVTLPSTYQLGLDNAKPSDDWTAIADLAGWVVRTDRMGTIVCGPAPDRAGLVADWQEGPDCPVTDMRRKVNNLGLYNRVLVRSTHTDAAGVYAIAEDSNPASPTWVGRYGPFTKKVETDAAKDEAACLAMAQMELGRLLRPTETVTVTVPQRPDLDYRDQIPLSRSKSAVGGTYRVSGYSLELGPADGGPKPMSVTLMTRSLE